MKLFYSTGTFRPYQRCRKSDKHIYYFQVVLALTDLLNVFVVSPGHLLMFASKEAFCKITEHTLEVHCIINQYDMYLDNDMWYNSFKPYYKVTALDYVVMFGPDLLRSVLHCWCITVNRKLTSVLVFISDHISCVKIISL